MAKAAATSAGVRYRPTVHGLLQTLQAHGFVEQDRDSDKYQPISLDVASL